MPDYSDPMDAAVRRPTVGGLGGAYNQTDVWHDRGWLEANLHGSNRSMQRAAKFALQNLNQQERLAQRQDSVQQSLGLRAAGLQQRSDMFQQRQGLAQQSLGLRELAMQDRNSYRDAVLDQNAVHFEANQIRMKAHDDATQAYHQLSTDRDTEIDQQGHGLMQTMLGLDGALRRGEISKDQYDEGLMQAGQQFPLGIRHPEAARHYEFAITEADKQNAFNARRELTQVAKIGAKYGIDPQFDPETGRPSIELTQQAALQTPKGKNEALGMMNKEMAQKYGVTTGVGSLFNPIAPHVGTDETGAQVENPTHVALPFQDQKTGAIGKLPVPVPLFNQMKSDFQDRYFALNPPSTGQPAGAAPTTIQAAPAAMPEISSAADYQGLPAGSTFIHGGKQYTKPAEQPVEQAQ